VEPREPLDYPTPFYGAFARALTPSLRAEMRGWALLAAGALAVAGLLALLLAASRTPGLQDILPWDGGSFFRKALVTHVVFAVLVWYLAMLGALSVAAAARAAEGRPRMQALGPPGLALAAFGALLLLIPTLADWGEASLNNYVPVLTHPLYYAGLAVLAAGVALPVLRLLAHPRRLGDPAVFGVAVAGLAFLTALLCFALAALLMPAGLDAANVNERLFWGGGHVLQFANTALMLTGWMMLCQLSLGDPPLSDRLFRAAILALAPFILAAPLFYGLHDVTSREHREAFTDLLRFGLVLPPLAVAAGVAVLIAKTKRPPWRSPAFLGLVCSLAVFGVGGVFGYFLGVSDTRTPSHYHAVIGGVNLAFMGLMLGFLLPLLGRAPPRRGMVRLQFPLYGAGQLLFALGLFIAGAAGVPRKTAGAEQGLDSLDKVAAMALTGVGGLIAVAGGVMFIWVSLRWLLKRRSALDDD